MNIETKRQPPLWLGDGSTAIQTTSSSPRSADIVPRLVRAKMMHSFLSCPKTHPWLTSPYSKTLYLMLAPMTDEKARLLSHLPDVIRSREFLLEILEDYKTALFLKKKDNEFMDINLAGKLIDGFRSLLLEDAQDLASIDGGISYLISTDDDIPDEDIAGFDDDAEVYNYVCGLCDRDDLKIDLGEY